MCRFAHRTGIRVWGTSHIYINNPTHFSRTPSLREVVLTTKNLMSAHSPPFKNTQIFGKCDQNEILTIQLDVLRLIESQRCSSLCVLFAWKYVFSISLTCKGIVISLFSLCVATACSMLSLILFFIQILLTVFSEYLYGWTLKTTTERTTNWQTPDKFVKITIERH